MSETSNPGDQIWICKADVPLAGDHSRRSQQKDKPGAHGRSGQAGWLLQADCGGLPGLVQLKASRAYLATLQNWRQAPRTSPGINSEEITHRIAQPLLHGPTDHGIEMLRLLGHGKKVLEGLLAMHTRLNARKPIDRMAAR